MEGLNVGKIPHFLVIGRAFSSVLGKWPLQGSWYCAMLLKSAQICSQVQGLCLEGDVSDIVALDQPTFAVFTSESDKNVALIFRKVRYFSFQIYTRVISSSLTSGEVQHAIHLVYIKN